jgi:hypothetical protein
LIKPTSQKTTEASVDASAAKTPELSPKSDSDQKKEAIAAGRNTASNRPEDKIGNAYKDTKPVEEKKQELPTCSKSLGFGVPCKRVPVCEGNGGSANPHQDGENCRPAGPPSTPAHQHLPPANLENSDGTGILTNDVKKVAEMVNKRKNDTSDAPKKNSTGEAAIKAVPNDTSEAKASKKADNLTANATKEASKTEESNSTANATEKAAAAAPELNKEKAKATSAGLAQLKNTTAPAKKEEAKATEEAPAPTKSAKDMEKQLDATPAEPPKSKSDSKKEAIASGNNVASNAVPPSDIKGDKILDPVKVAKVDDRASEPMCNGKNGHPGVDCRPMPVC